MGRSKEWDKFMYKGKKTLSPGTQKQIRFLVDRQHCGEPASEVANAVVDRIKNVQATPRWLITKVRTYATAVHQKNQKLCRGLK